MIYWGLAALTVGALYLLMKAERGERFIADRSTVDPLESTLWDLPVTKLRRGGASPYRGDV